MKFNIIENHQPAYDIEEAKARVKELQANNWNGLLKGE